MSFVVAIQDETCQILERVIDEQNVLMMLLRDEAATEFQLLRFIDPYGDTIFNRPQIATVLAELERIAVNASTKATEFLEAVKTLALRVAAEPHLYLKIIGD